MVLAERTLRINCFTVGHAGVRSSSNLRGDDEGRQAANLREDMAIHNPWRGQEREVTIEEDRKEARGGIRDKYGSSHDSS
jgi:hypothetical protein